MQSGVLQGRSTLVLSRFSAHFVQKTCCPFLTYSTLSISTGVPHLPLQRSRVGRRSPSSDASLDSGPANAQSLLLGLGRAARDSGHVQARGGRRVPLGPHSVGGPGPPGGLQGSCLGHEAIVVVTIIEEKGQPGPGGLSDGDRLLLRSEHHQPPVGALGQGDQQHLIRPLTVSLHALAVGSGRLLGEEAREALRGACHPSHCGRSELAGGSAHVQGNGGEGAVAVTGDLPDREARRNARLACSQLHCFRRLSKEGHGGQAKRRNERSEVFHWLRSRRNLRAGGTGRLWSLCCSGMEDEMLWLQFDGCRRAGQHQGPRAVVLGTLEDREVAVQVWLAGAANDDLGVRDELRPRSSWLPLVVRKELGLKDVVRRVRVAAAVVARATEVEVGTRAAPLARPNKRADATAVAGNTWVHWQLVFVKLGKHLLPRLAALPQLSCGDQALDRCNGQGMPLLEQSLNLRPRLSPKRLAVNGLDHVTRCGPMPLITHDHRELIPLHFHWP